MGKYSFPLHGNFQSHTSSEMRPWPGDDDDNTDYADDAFPSEEGVHLGSQKECSPK